jgi:hypothetical protein
MKRIMCLPILILASCTPANLPPASATPSRVPIGSSFTFNQECPHVCWLGINPGITTPDEAEDILMAAKKIDQDRLFQRSRTELKTIWFTENTNTFYSRVWLHFDGNTISSIHFNMLSPFTVGDFISRLGEPNSIIIELDDPTDGAVRTEYAVYFSPQKVSLSVYPGSWDGPSPNDKVDALTLNAEFTYSIFLSEGTKQPWLGYGRLDEYLPGQVLPTGPND